MKEEKDKLRDFMQGVFQEYEVKPDPEDWNRIEETLSKKKIRRFIPWFIGAAAASLLLLLALYTGGILKYSDNEIPRMAVNQNTIHKTQTLTNLKTKLATAATPQTKVAENQQSVTHPKVINRPNTFVTLATGSIPEHIAKLVSNKRDKKQTDINTVRTSDSINLFHNNDLFVHSISPIQPKLIAYNSKKLFNTWMDLQWYEPIKIVDPVFKYKYLAFNGLSASNNSGLIIESGGKTNAMNAPASNYTGSFATQLASNMYSITSFDNSFLASTNIGKLYQNKSRNYLPPVTFGLNINLSLQPNWSLETGIQYSQLQSSGVVPINSSNNLQFTTVFAYNVNEHLYYLGIPIIINYSFAQKRKTSYYLSGGLSIEKGLIAKYVANPEDNFNGMKPIISHNPIKGLQYSLTSGLGFSYKFINHFELFGQPSVSYYFNSYGDKTNVYSVHPLMFNLRTGIRYTIK